MRITHIFGNNKYIPIKDNDYNSNTLRYKELIKIISESRMDISDSLADELANLKNNIETFYFDLKYLQMLWAKENGLKINDENWMEQILLEQINKVKPEVIFFQKFLPLKKNTLLNLKKKFHFIKKIVYHTAYLGTTWGGFAVDHLLVGTPSLVHRYKKIGMEPKLFYHYFDPRITEKIKVPSNFSEKKYDFTFVGSSGFNGGYLHADRFYFLKYLLEKTDILMWVSEEDSSEIYKKTFKQKIREISKIFIKSLPIKLIEKIIIAGCMSNLLLETKNEKLFYIKGGKLPNKKLQDMYPLRCFQSVHGLDYYSIIANSKISFTKSGNNIHSPEYSQFGDVGALRLFETTGLESCLVADNGKNMHDLFEDGKEIICYVTKEEALEKIKYLLDNPNYCKQIAENGKKKTYKSHLAKNRAELFCAIINGDI
jgi:spore maturation protein CgeB